MDNNTFIGQIQEFNRYAEGTVAPMPIKLDLIDRKILYLLCENARLSHTFIAKQLKIKRETVSYRIKRMMEQDFLHGHLTLLDHRKIGLKNYLVYIKLKTLENEPELIDYLLTNPKISRLKNCAGSYDLQLIFSVATEEEFASLLENIVNQHHSIIHGHDIFEILEENFLGIGFLLNAQERKNILAREQKGSTFQKYFEHASRKQEASHLNSMEVLSLDAKDKEILKAMQLEGDISIKKLSNDISLAPIAVENRIKKLIQSGVIKCFYPVASLHKLGYQWWKVLVKFKNLDKRKFNTYLRTHPNILWYMKLLGKWDYQFSIFARDNSEFHHILGEVRSEFVENIISYDSLIVFNQFKHQQLV